LYDARASDTLGEVLVRRADDYALDTRIPSCSDRRRSQCVVCLELYHRPDNDARRREDAFKQWELRE
jgi:hypothetical protein